MLRLFQSLKQYKDGHQPLYHFSLIILFWALADGVFSYVLPVFMEQSLKNLSLVGLVFSSSSVFGLISSFYLGSEQKGRTFKPYYLISMALAIIAYLLALKAHSWFIFIIIMALWGVYYEGINFCWMDFLNRFSQKFEHSGAAGILQMFSALGYLLGPIIAGFLIFQGRLAILPALTFVLISSLFFIFWFGRKKIEPDVPKRILGSKQELRVWLRVVKKSFWVVLANFLITTFWESLIWSMGPILLTATANKTASLVMSCFILPSVFLRGYSGRLADQKGKKKFIILGFIIAGLFLSLFGLSPSSGGFIFKSLMAFGSAVGVCLFWPASDGLFIDLVNGYTKDNEEEVAGVRGAAHNLGYIIGPLMAGFLGSSLGLPTTFFLYGIFWLLEPF